MLYAISVYKLLCMFHLLKHSNAVTRQKALYVSDFCPNFTACHEEPHILCKYYNPDQLMHPRCNLPSVTLTHEAALRIVELCNAMRSKIANGLETGKYGAHFPRGYGMNRLNWDRELATLAQVTANQCSRFRLLACRATLKFHNPSQFLCSISVPYNTTNMEKHLVSYITKILKQVYLQKNQSPVDWINGFEDRSGWSSLNPKSYFYIIHGPATHIGCAVSYFRSTTNKGRPEEHNLLNLICNFSTRPTSDGSQKLYNTTAPTTYGYSRQCGCKLPYIEDDDCLCNIGSTEKLFCIKNNTSCSPSPLALPIYKLNNLSNTNMSRKPSKITLRTSIFSKTKTNKKEHSLPEERQVDIFGNNDDIIYMNDLASFFNTDIEMYTREYNETSDKAITKEFTKASELLDSRMLTVLNRLEEVVHDVTLDLQEKDAIYKKLRDVNNIFVKTKKDEQYFDDITSVTEGHREKISYKTETDSEKLNPIANYDFIEDAENNNFRHKYANENIFENNNDEYSLNDKNTLYNYKLDKLMQLDKILKDVCNKKQVPIKDEPKARPIKQMTKLPARRPILPENHNLFYVIDRDKIIPISKTITK